VEQEQRPAAVPPGVVVGAGQGKVPCADEAVVFAVGALTKGKAVPAGQEESTQSSSGL
jgi:hypothetical protein